MLRNRLFVVLAICAYVPHCGVGDQGNSQGREGAPQDGGADNADGDGRTEPPTCAPECTVGQQRCVGDLLQRCETPGDATCGKWSEAQSCEGDTLCRNDVCVSPCSDGEQSRCDDVGICSEGSRACVDGYFGACQWQEGPREETCDDVDEDCNGVVDDVDFELCPLQGGVCAGSRGRCLGQAEVCDSAVYAGQAAEAGKVYEEVETSCDGVDNDCDGVVDEVKNSDPKNCGLCGHDCGDLECVNGACACQRDAQCGEGQSCVDGACQGECKKDGDCALGHVCLEGQCIKGCGAPGPRPDEGQLDRCPVGQACVPDCDQLGRCVYTCSRNCEGLPCRGEDWSCWAGPDQDKSDSQCMQACAKDTECSSDTICQWFTSDRKDPAGASLSFCAPPCDSNAVCKESAISSTGAGFCTCSDNQCRSLGHACYYTEAL